MDKMTKPPEVDGYYDLYEWIPSLEKEEGESFLQYEKIAVPEDDSSDALYGSNPDLHSIEDEDGPYPDKPTIWPKPLKRILEP